jgi:hypothetical protein
MHLGKRVEISSRILQPILHGDYFIPYAFDAVQYYSMATKTLSKSPWDEKPQQYQSADFPSFGPANLI